MLPLLTPKLPEVPDRRGQDSVKDLFQGIEKTEHERRSFRERRATPRVAVTLTLEVDDEEAGRTVVHRTHDLSTFGLSISTGATPRKGSKLKVRVFLADDSTEPLEFTGEVLGAFDANGGARLKFIRPAVTSVRRLHRFLK